MNAKKRPLGAKELPGLFDLTAAEIEQAAAEWVVQVERDRTVSTSRVLAAWLDNSPRHRAAFLRISIAWRRADVMRRLADPDEEPDPDLLAPEGLRADVLEQTQLSSTQRPERHSYVPAASPPRLAAGIAARAAVLAGALSGLVRTAFRRR